MYNKIFITLLSNIYEAKTIADDRIPKLYIADKTITIKES
jgi:hypothetical protein